MHKVFISSRISEEMAPWRDATSAAIECLGMTPLRAEEIAAKPSTPRGTCLDLVAQSNMVILLVGREAGAVKSSGLTATEEEIQEARRLGRAVLVFVVDEALDRRQQDFLRGLQDWATGNMTIPCRDQVHFMKEVVQALRAQSGPQVDEDRVQAVTAAIQGVLYQDRPSTISGQGPWVGLTVATPQAFPLDEDAFFAGLVNDFVDVLLTGPVRLLDQRPEVRAHADHVVLVSRNAVAGPTLHGLLTCDGLLALGVPFRHEGGGMEEAALACSFARPSWSMARLERTLRAAHAWFGRIDPDRRIQSVLVQAGISNLGHAFFAEPRRKPTGGVPIRMFSAKAPILAFPEGNVVGRDRLASAQEFSKHLVSRLQRIASVECQDFTT